MYYYEIYRGLILFSKFLIEIHYVEIRLTGSFINHNIIDCIYSVNDRITQH